MDDLGTYFADEVRIRKSAFLQRPPWHSAQTARGRLATRQPASPRRPASSLAEGWHCHGGKLGPPGFRSPRRQEVDMPSNGTWSGLARRNRPRNLASPWFCCTRRRDSKPRRKRSRQTQFTQLAHQYGLKVGSYVARHHGIRTIFTGNRRAELDSDRTGRRVVLQQRSDLPLRGRSFAPVTVLRREGAAPGCRGHETRPDPLRPDVLVA